MVTRTNQSARGNLLAALWLVGIGVAVLAILGLVELIFHPIQFRAPAANAASGNLPPMEIHTTATVVNSPAASDAPLDWGTELLPTLDGTIHGKEGTVLVLAGSDRVGTEMKYTPPVAFRVMAMTDSTNLRFSFAGARDIIFNWEKNPDEFRIDGGPADGRDQPRAGRIAVNQWVEIGLVLQTDSLTVVVDGLPRFTINADFSKVNQKLFIFPASGSTIKIKSVRVEKDEDKIIDWEGAPTP
jgi:hypothetical protein